MRSSAVLQYKKKKLDESFKEIMALFDKCLNQINPKGFTPIVINLSQLVADGKSASQVPVSRVSMDSKEKKSVEKNPSTECTAFSFIEGNAAQIVSVYRDTIQGAHDLMMGNLEQMNTYHIAIAALVKEINTTLTQQLVALLQDRTKAKADFKAYVKEVVKRGDELTAKMQELRDQREEQRTLGFDVAPDQLAFLNFVKETCDKIKILIDTVETIKSPTGQKEAAKFKDKKEYIVALLTDTAEFFVYLKSFYIDIATIAQDYTTIQTRIDKESIPSAQATVATLSAKIDMLKRAAGLDKEVAPKPAPAPAASLLGDTIAVINQAVKSLEVTDPGSPGSDQNKRKTPPRMAPAPEAAPAKQASVVDFGAFAASKEKKAAASKQRDVLTQTPPVAVSNTYR